jgi:hypothetical protein
MSDAVQIAEPVAAPVETTAPRVGLSDLTPTQRDNWLKTGDLPSSEPEPTPDPAPATEASQPPTGTEPTPVEPTAEKKHKARDDHQARIAQAVERQRAAEARAEAAEAKLAAAAAKPADVGVGTTAPGPAASSSPTLQERLAKPLDYPAIANDADFWREYPEASISDLSRYTARYEQFSILRDQQQAAQAQSYRQKAEEAVDKAWKAGPEKYPDWDLTPLREAIVGPSAALITELAFSSPSSVDVLYHLSKNPAEARSLAAMEPLAAAHALGKLESSLSTPAPSRIAAPTKTVSSAPEPPQTLGSRHTPAAGDEMEQAIRDKDTGRYIELANKRELAEKKAGRR